MDRDLVEKAAELIEIAVYDDTENLEDMFSRYNHEKVCSNLTDVIGD